jgi:uncharacterized NAD-dependent epimerase/dehydratase family protein
MHGALPDYMIVCHAPARKFMRHTDIPVVSPGEMASLSEAILRPIHPSRVVGVAVNCHGMEANAAARARAEIEAETGLPVVDPLGDGVGRLVDALLGRRHA